MMLEFSLGPVSNDMCHNTGGLTMSQRQGSLAHRPNSATVFLYVLQVKNSFHISK